MNTVSCLQPPAHDRSTNHAILHPVHDPAHDQCVPDRLLHMLSPFIPDAADSIGSHPPNHCLHDLLHLVPTFSANLPVSKKSEQQPVPHPGHRPGCGGAQFALACDRRAPRPQNLRRLGVDQPEDALCSNMALPRSRGGECVPPLKRSTRGKILHPQNSPAREISQPLPLLKPLYQKPFIYQVFT